MCLLEVFYVESVEESESENKNLRSRGIKISDECVYDRFSSSKRTITLDLNVRFC